MVTEQGIDFFGNLRRIRCGPALLQIRERIDAFEDSGKLASRFIDHEHHVVNPLGGSREEARVHGDGVTRHDFVQIMDVVFEVEGAGFVRAVILSCQADAVLKGISCIIENDQVPADIHVPVLVPIGFRDNDAQARGRELSNAVEGNRGGFHSTIIQARRWALIADDLTGACDAGAEFARRGFSTIVSLDSSHDPGSSADVLVLTTDSRELDEHAAAERASACCRQLQARRIPVLMQKVDSALRGHWAAQTVCIADLNGRSRVFISPTFPEYGRTLVQGRVQAATLPGIDAYAELRRVAGDRARSIDVHRLAEEQETDRSIALVDTRTHADLAKLVRYAFERWPDALLVGSAAMAAEIASELAPHCPPERAPQQDHGWVVYWIGSLHPATCEQVAWLKRRAAPEEMVRSCRLRQR